jgi:hypothetical protein
MISVGLGPQKLPTRLYTRCPELSEQDTSPAASHSLLPHVLFSRRKPQRRDPTLAVGDCRCHPCPHRLPNHQTAQPMPPCPDHYIMPQRRRWPFCPPPRTSPRRGRAEALRQSICRSRGHHLPQSQARRHGDAPTRLRGGNGPAQPATQKIPTGLHSLPPAQDGMRREEAVLHHLLPQGMAGPVRLSRRRHAADRRTVSQIRPGPGIESTSDRWLTPARSWVDLDRRVQKLEEREGRAGSGHAAPDLAPPPGRCILSSSPPLATAAKSHGRIVLITLIPLEYWPASDHVFPSVGCRPSRWAPRSRGGP